MILNSKEQRNFFRYDVKSLPVHATILNYMDIENNNEVINDVGIVNIGAGGLSFITPTQLDIHQNLLIQFEFILEGKPYKFVGLLCWIKKLDMNNNAYGCEFITEEKNRLSLLSQLNQLMIFKRKIKSP